MPLVVSPKDPHISLSFFQAWANAHQIELKSLLSEYGVLLLRDFPVETPEEFAAVVKAVVGSELRSYKGGEGSRKKITEGVYTSTEAPPQFKIPLHNELTCTNDPNSYICFYCEIAPEPGSGQTILGRTDQVSAEILQNHPDLWNFFNGHNIKYISRHPPEGSFFSKVNKTHKTWPQAFETTDKQEVGGKEFARKGGLNSAGWENGLRSSDLLRRLESPMNTLITPIGIIRFICIILIQEFMAVG